MEVHSWLKLKMPLTVDKAICVDGAIRTRERMSKDHRSSTTEAKGGSDSSENYEVKGESVSSQQCGNGNAPIATCEQNIAESDSQYRLNPHL
ncbi:hypothetical protein VNO78_12016 [Psophocarpus tetragonolobus]|uniref:Uncharacterized protein n=1 Tax=Psophocarpus tetragonolobus TaxID=3891 RepID=A0AAN9SNC8_PSOTE